MPLEELLAAITAEGEAQVERLDAESEAEAARLVGGARERVARARAEAQHAAELRLSQEREAALTAARRESAAELLRIRRQLLDAVFRRATELLPDAVSDERYIGALPAEVLDAVAYLPETAGDAAVLRCSPVLAPVLAATPRITIAPDAAVGTGFVVRSGDGTVEVDGTLEARLARLRPALAIEILRTLRDDDG